MTLKLSTSSGRTRDFQESAIHLALCPQLYVSAGPAIREIPCSIQPAEHDTAISRANPGTQPALLRWADAPAQIGITVRGDGVTLGMRT
jgi:hypothetical protein